MFEISRIAQSRIQVSHHLDHRVRLLVTQISVMYRHQIINHLMHMPTILGQHEFLPFEIIIFIHKEFCGLHDEPFPQGSTL